jgi:hypothetical protein
VKPNVAVPKRRSASEANTATRSVDLRQKMKAATTAYVTAKMMSVATLPAA